MKMDLSCKDCDCQSDFEECYHVIHCPLHESAPELLKALKRLLWAVGSGTAHQQGAIVHAEAIIAQCGKQAKDLPEVTEQLRVKAEMDAARCKIEEFEPPY